MCFEPMLMKRTRSLHKDHHHFGHMAITETNHGNYSQFHSLGRNVKSNSIFNAPLLFGPKAMLDSESVRSPTSPLDVTFLSKLSNPSRRTQHRSWDCSKVGLSIIDSLQESSKFSGKIYQSSENKKASNLSPQMMIKTKTPNCRTYFDSVVASKSLPKDFCKLPYNTQKGESSTVLFEIGESLQESEPFGKTRSSSLDFFSPIRDLSENFALNQFSSPPYFIGGSQNSNPASSFCSSDEFVKSLSASEIELSEDYTCVISHGSNPKVTHIFCDCILDTDPNDSKIHFKIEEKEEVVSSLVVNRLQTQNLYPSSNFLSFCFHCNKRLEEGKDIYIYRGEKSFCSLDCRAIEIMNDDDDDDDDVEVENSNPSCENSPKFELGGGAF